MAAGGALVEGYFALPRAEVDKGFKPPLSPPSLYTIMPFDELNEDLFYYSIQSAGKKFGLQVERADPSDFTGDIISQIFNRISDAELIVADLSHSNPNIYYELGFAVALQKRVILSAKSETRLPYVVQGQHRIEYDSIPDHQDQLLQEIEKVMAGGTR
jgi:hypothetical protein